MHLVHRLEITFSRRQSITLNTAIEVLWPKVRGAEPRRSSAPFRGATPDSALPFSRFIP